MLVSDSGSLFLSSGVILAIILKEFVPKIKIVLFFVFLLFFFFYHFLGRLTRLEPLDGPFGSTSLMFDTTSLKYLSPKKVV